MKKDPLRVFKDTTKKFLSSLSARSCPFLYINLPGFEDRMILTNATPDMFVTLSSLPQIAFHVIKPTSSYLDTFKEIFLHDVYSKETVYCFKTPGCVKIVQSLSSLGSTEAITVDPVTQEIISQDLVSTVSVEETVETDVTSSDEVDFKDELDATLDQVSKVDVISHNARLIDNQLIGIPVCDPHILAIIEKFALLIEDDLAFCRTHEGHGSLAIPLHDIISKGLGARFYANWFYTPFFSGDELYKAIPHDKCPYTAGYKYCRQRLVLIEGKDTPSIVEFLAKIKNLSTSPSSTDPWFTFYIYTNDHIGSVKKLSYYADEAGDVCTTRPMDQIYICRTKDSTQLSTK